MKLTLINTKHKPYKKTVTKYLIKWDEPSKSKLQYRFKQLFKKYWIGHTVFEEFPVFGTRQRVDFVNISLNIAVEINGLQHDKYTPHFHKNTQGFIKSLRLDREKREWLEMNNFNLIELMESDEKLFSPKYIEKEYGHKIVL